MSKSPNYMSRYGWKPDMIVMHVCEGSFNGSVSWLCNPNSGTSSHFVTGKNGEREQLVDLDKAAWCNGTAVKEGAMYDYRRSTNRLVRERKTNANYYTISIENEGYSYKDGCGALTEPQYQTTLQICKELITKYGIPVDREHIVGHYEIAPKEKPNCPGPNFPWDRLMNDLREWQGGSKPSPTNQKVDVYYRVKTQKHGWLNEIKNYNNVDSMGYAGWENSPITALALRVNKGSVKYRVHVKGGGWLGWITKCDINDYYNGYAGNGKPIDAVQIYYYTPDDIRPYKKATYKVNNYGWQHDTDTNNGQDGYAGVMGVVVTKLRVGIE